MSRRDEHRTLFAVPLESAQGAGTTVGARTAPKPQVFESSDVRRFGPVVFAALAAAIGVLIAFAATPAGPTTGAVALPHRQAGLTCDSCHEGGVPSQAAAKRCVGCHQPHPSTRRGHRGLAQSGKLRCVDCHDVHGTDQGIRFQDGEAIRYFVGGEVVLEGDEAERYAEAFAERGHALTVPLVPLERCARCHDLQGDDPIGRCRQRDGGDFNVCFDEHQRWSAIPSLQGDAPAAADGVCSDQHQPNARFAVWEAARAVALEAEVVRPPAKQAAFTWLAAGGAGALLGGLAFSVGRSLRRRFRRRQAAPISVKPATIVRLPQIDTSTCLGCYACVDACPYDVLQIDRYVAVVARPEACCGLILCEQVCPNGSLAITDGEPIGDRPRLDDQRQSLDTPGVALAGDITGVPLIKNAIAQGERAMDAIADSQPAGPVVVIGAGPAGISAALHAKARGLDCVVLEQGSVAQSIRSFPRGKLVFDQPLDLPVSGQLWLEECTKEELLRKWLRIVRQEKLAIREGRRFVGLRGERGGFTVTSIASDGGDEQSHPAARVLLAAGMRGTPRRLDITLSSEAESRVHYHLADARSFADQRVLVVGLGDVAMEAAIALAHQPSTTVTVSYRGADFSRGKQRNIDELERLVRAGRVAMAFGSEVTAFDGKRVTFTGAPPLEVDAMLVMIGSLPPRDLLRRAGVSCGD